MKSDLVTGFLAGVIVIVLVAHIPGSIIDVAKTAKKECEKHLPRDEHCVIIAVPISKD